MLTFSQFLAEKFVTLVKGEAAWNARNDMDSQVSIYQDATETEVCQKEAKSDGVYYLGAWLVPAKKTWYCWARQHIEHAKARSAPKVNVPDSGAVPIYIWYDAGAGTAKIQISSFSAGDEDVSTKDIQPAIDAIPSFKKTFRNYRVMDADDSYRDPDGDSSDY